MGAGNRVQKGRKMIDMKKCKVTCGVPEELREANWRVIGLAKALRAIANTSTGDLTEYVVKVDEIAVEALERYDPEHEWVRGFDESIGDCVYGLRETLLEMAALLKESGDLGEDIIEKAISRVARLKKTIADICD